MTKADLAKALRQIQKDKKWVESEILDRKTDDEILNAYIVCRCGNERIALSTLTETLSGISTVPEFLALLDKGQCHIP